MASPQQRHWFACSFQSSTCYPPAFGLCTCSPLPSRRAGVLRSHRWRRSFFATPIRNTGALRAPSVWRNSYPNAWQESLCVAMSTIITVCVTGLTRGIRVDARCAAQVLRGLIWAGACSGANSLCLAEGWASRSENSGHHARPRQRWDCSRHFSTLHICRSAHRWPSAAQAHHTATGRAGRMPLLRVCGARSRRDVFEPPRGGQRVRVVHSSQHALRLRSQLCTQLCSVVAHSLCTFVLCTQLCTVRSTVRSTRT